MFFNVPKLDIINAWGYLLIDEYIQIKDPIPALKRLKIPNFTIDETLTATLGSWNETARLITISEKLLELGTWEDIRLVLKHEMAHQIVSEIFDIRNAKSHGLAFRRACKILEIPYSRCYTPSALRSELNPGRNAKVHKLLALSNSSNKFEAERALQKAHELILKYNIEMQNKESYSRYGVRILGPVYKRTPSFVWRIVSILEKFYFVQYIRRPVRRSSCTDQKSLGNIFEIYGTIQNLDLAEYAYYFLLNQGAIEWEAYRKLNDLQNNKFKISFLSGLYQGFQQKLEQHTLNLQDNRALVWTGDKNLNRFFRQRNPYIRRLRSTSEIDIASHSAGERFGKHFTIVPGLQNHPSAPRIAGALVR